MVTRGDLVRRLTRVVTCGLLAAVAFPASLLADSSTSTTSQTVTAVTPIIDACTGETTTGLAFTHITMQVQPDGTFKTFVNSQGSSVTPSGATLTLSEETHEYSTPTIDDYTKVIRQGETFLVAGDDEFLHTHFDGVNTYGTFECR